MVVEAQRELPKGYEAFRIATKRDKVTIGIIAAGNDTPARAEIRGQLAAVHGRENLSAPCQTAS
ncbi:MAG: hypothetical protein HY736_25015 [Verrucomicrobia bacterium]|nr:hypothetical protein [Verrucomicrobiota bacterium]